MAMLLQHILVVVAAAAAAGVLVWQAARVLRGGCGACGGCGLGTTGRPPAPGAARAVFVPAGQVGIRRRFREVVEHERPLADGAGAS